MNARIMIPVLWIALAHGASVRAQEIRELPFGVGEELTYHVRMGRFGGRGTMRVDPGGEIRGTGTMLLSFQIGARVGLFRVSNEMRSWIDPLSLSDLRFAMHEHAPLR